jgi:hypothetical protein
MADAQTNAARIGFLLEPTYGSTVALAAALKTLRFSDESIAHHKNAAWSAEINSNGDRVLVQDMSKSAAGSFTSELSFTDFEQWLRAGIRAGAGVVTGGITAYTNSIVQSSFYLEKQLTDIANGFLGFYGMTISEFSLALAANNLAKITVGFSGKKGTKEAATRGISAIVAPAQDPGMRSGGDVASLLLGGAAFPCAVQSLNLSATLNVRPKTELSSDSPTEQHGGTFDLSGTMKCYFPSTALYEDYLNHTARALSFSIANSAGRFGINLPSIQITNATAPIGGVNQDVMSDITFLASRGDVTKPYTMELEVEPAV